jgi:hypothetical protein
MKNKLSKNILIQLVVAVVFIIVAFVVNSFPRNSFIAGGDFYQLLDPIKHFERYSYAWLNQIGQGSFNTLFATYPFYALLALLQKIGMSSGMLSSFMIFFVTYLSYWSFFYSIKKFFPNISLGVRIGGALVYAFNNFTLTIFTYPWGFNHHFFAYIFVPPLIALFYQLLSDRSFKVVLEFNIVLLLAIISLNNLAFLAAIILCQFFVLIFALIFRAVKFNKILLLQILKIAVSYAVSTGMVVAVWFLALGDSLGNVAGSQALGGSLKGWILATSSNFINTFTLSMDSSRIPIVSSKFLTAFSLLYIIFLVGLAIRALAKINMKNRDETRNKTIIFLVLFLGLAFLSVRAYSLFAMPNLIIYQLPFFNFFRSPEKLFMLIPFVYLVSIVGLFAIVKMKKIYEYVILAVLLIIPSAFYTGQIVREMTGRDNDAYGYVTEIPTEYTDAAKIINASKLDSAVVSLPYSVVNSVNWSNYPVWGFVGQDPLHLLFDKRYISANTYDHPLIEKRPTFQYTSNAISSSQFEGDLQKFDAEFVIVHKDVDEKWLKDSEKLNLLAQELVSSGRMVRLENNSLFTLYQLKPENVRPLISSNAAKIVYQKINNTRYDIQIKGLKDDSTIRFDQSFNRYWKLYFAPKEETVCKEKTSYPQYNSSSCEIQEKYLKGDELGFLGSKNISDSSHKLADGYANSWQVSAPEVIAQNPDSLVRNADGTIDVNLTIYFEPQTYLYLLFGGNGLLLLIALALLALKMRKPRQND